MVSLTIAFQPSPVIAPTAITEIKIFRKADLSTPVESYLVEDWAELPSLLVTSGFDAPTFTDPNGNKDFWYRTQTCSAERCAPMGPVIPGHGNSAFASLRAGYGYLSDFTPNSIDVTLIYDELHKATESVIEEYLRPKFEETDINAMYLEPLPRVRQLTEIMAARSIILQLKPTNKEALDMLKQESVRLAKSFGIRETYRTNDLTEKEMTRKTPAELVRKWGR